MSLGRDPSFSVSSSRLMRPWFKKKYLIIRNDLCHFAGVLVLIVLTCFLPRVLQNCLLRGPVDFFL